MKHRIALVTVALVGGLVAVLTVLSIMLWTATAARAERWVEHSSTGPTAVSSRGITQVSQPGLSVLYVAAGGDCGGMSPCYGSIQMAVDAANTGDVIKVATGTYTDVSARAGVTQAVYISKTVTIHGGYTTVNWGVSDPEANPTILDAQGQGRVLYVSFCSPTIKSLHITGGYIYGEPWSARGAGVFLYYSDATLIGNTIYGNRAIGPGGGGGGVFLAEESDATLVGNVIRDNVATSGGGIHGDASFYADTYAMLISNIIRNNTAQRGGGVYLGIRGFRLINNVIADNYARISGSGVYVWGGDHRLIHNTIVRNTGGNGSGVFVSTYGSHIGTVAMTNTILADQMVGISIAAPQSTAILNGVLWSGNGANTGGAGSITVTNAITGSPAFVDPDGGDYHIGGTSAAVDRGLTVDFLLDMDEDYRFLAAPPDLGADEIVTTPAPQCQARLNGGGTIYPTLQAAIVTSTSASDVVEVAGICEDVVPWNGGSVVAVLTRTLTVRGGYSPDFGTWDPNAYPTILGGRFQNRVLAIGAGVRPTVEYLTLFGGRAVGEGGGLWSEGDGPTLRHLQVSYSSAGRGGGIYLGGSNAYLKETRVVGNRASVGGGVYIQSITTTLNANLVHSNWAVDGGGVYLDESAVTLNGNIFTYNTSSWDGGGMYLYKSAAILGNNTFIGNISKYGGGTYLDTSEATFRDSIVSNNIARHGGGIYLYHSDATLSDNTIEGNTARDRDPYHGGTGGGVYLDYSDATLSGNVIRANTATGNGGGGYLIESAATLNGNVVSGNTAKGGGGLYLAWHSDAMLSKNTITDNSADYSGGGGYLSGSAATLNGNTISGNAANGLYWQCGETPCGGGGIHLDESPATLSANTITANTAQMNGGGLVMRHSNATLNGNIVGDNSADYGGGLALYQSDATGTNNAVFDNQANVAGSGLYVRESSPRLLHITIAGNSGGDGNGIYVAQTPCPYLDLPAYSDEIVHEFRACRPPVGAKRR
jgi:parallel beta-helix repeat protein